MRPYLFTQERFHCLLLSWENPNRLSSTKGGNREQENKENEIFSH